MRLAAVLVLVVAGAAGCATSTTFKTFEMRVDAIHEGRGGAKTVHDGMEIWVQGDPPQRYRVIGIIDDRRPDGVISMGQLLPEVVMTARRAGGQALIQLGNQSRVDGHQPATSAIGAADGPSASATMARTGTPLRRNFASFLVIRYVD